MWVRLNEILTRENAASLHRVLHIIKLNLFPVPVRLHSGSGKLKLHRYYHHYLRFKNVVHRLEPGVTRRLTRLQTMHNVLTNSKTL